MALPDYTRLKAQLRGTGLTRDNYSLFQLIDSLIDSVGQSQNTLNASIINIQNNTTVISPTTISIPGIDGIDGDSISISSVPSLQDLISNFTLNSIPFVGASGFLLQDNANFIYNASISALCVTNIGINNTNPIDRLDINGNVRLRTNGTIATPTIYQAGHSTGYYFPGNDILGFVTNNNERAIIDASGNFGINTTTPQSILEVAKNGAGNQDTFYLTNTQAAAAGVGSSINFSNGSVRSGAIQGSWTGAATTDGALVFQTRQSNVITESMRLDNLGHMGVGNPNPTAQVDITSDSGVKQSASGYNLRVLQSDGFQSAALVDCIAINGIMTFRRANGTSASPSKLLNGQKIGTFSAAGYGATGYSGNRAAVNFLADQDWTDTAQGTAIGYYTTSNGSATPGGTLRFKIDNAGNLSVSTGIFIQYNGLTTTGFGVPAILGLDNRTGLTVADGAPITLYIPFASNNIFEISAQIFATATVTGAANYTIVWKQNGASQSMTVTSTAINVPNTQTQTIRPDNGTFITAQLTGTFTGTFTVVASVKQVA